MDFRILGPVCASVDGREIVLDGAKQRTVLAALLLARGRVLSDAQLSTLLWDWSPPATASAQMCTYVSRLRKRLGPKVDIVRQPPGYLIRVDAAQFDYAEFERLTVIGQHDLATGRAWQAAHHLRTALALWRGPPLANVTGFMNDSAVPELDEARIATLESRIEAELQLGRHAPLVAELTGLVAEHPLRERIRVQLMTALYRCDRQADAITVYQDGQRILAEELGVDPGTALSVAYHDILTSRLALDPAAVRRDPGSVNWTNMRPAMLPPDVVDFTGRNSQLAEVCGLLRGQSRNVGTRPTFLLTGMAGVGKTALALHAAHATLSDFPDGQLFVDLTGTADRPKHPYEVLGSFLKALGVEEWAIPADLDERVQLYRSRLADRRMLVLLDGAATDTQVRPLLPGGSRCRVIVTSRLHLATLDGAYVACLDVLDTQGAQQLLAAIAGSARAAAEPAAGHQIVELCGRLPLAVRIAGTRLAGRPQWTLARLAQRLVDGQHRLDELELSGMSVRDSIARSYDGLDGAARLALRRLSLVPEASYPAWLAAGLLGTPERDAERILETLADARLLDIAGVDRMGFPRYCFHELVLCFARERAAEEHDDAIASPLPPIVHNGSDEGGARFTMSGVRRSSTSTHRSG